MKNNLKQLCMSRICSFKFINKQRAVNKIAKNSQFLTVFVTCPEWINHKVSVCTVEPSSSPLDKTSVARGTAHRTNVVQVGTKVNRVWSAGRKSTATRDTFPSPTRVPTHVR